jgi:hypothetical protein
MAACGGGGSSVGAENPGDSSGSNPSGSDNQPNSPDSPPGDTSSPPDDSTGSPDDSTGSPPGDSTPTPDSDGLAISANPTRLQFKTFLSTQYQSQSQQMHVTFIGDGVLIGYAPNVPAPNWLQVEQENIVAPSGQFDLPVTVLPVQEQGLGTYTTSLRLVTGKLATNVSRFIDVPVQLSILTPPPIYTGGVTFNALTTDAGLPAPKTINLNFGGYTNPTFEVSLQNANSLASSWVSVTTSVADRTITIAINSAQPVGSYKASLLVRYSASGAAGLATIPIQYDVIAGAPQISYVVPNAIYDSVATDIVVRGAGFALSPVQSVTVGGMSALSFHVVDDSQIMARLPAIATPGDQTVQVQLANAQSASYPVTIKAPPPAIAGNLYLGEWNRKARFDSLHDAILVGGSHTLFRVQVVDGSWQVVAQRPIAGGRELGIESFDLTPDSRFIVHAEKDTIKMLDAVTLQDAGSFTLPDIAGLPPERYETTSVEAILNTGEILVGLYGGNTGTLYTLQLTNKILTATTHTLYLTMVARDSMRTRALLANNNTGRDGFTGFFFGAGVPDLRAATLPDRVVYGNRFAISRDSTRVVLNDSLYDGAFNVLGDLKDPAVFNYSIELSPDGRRAYFISAGDGTIRSFDVSGPPPFTSSPYTTFPSYSYYGTFPNSQITPDGGMMILDGGQTNDAETRLTIVPLP